MTISYYQVATSFLENQNDSMIDRSQTT